MTNQDWSTWSTTGLQEEATRLCLFVPLNEEELIRNACTVQAMQAEIFRRQGAEPGVIPF